MYLVCLPIHFHFFSQIVKKVFLLSFHVWRKNGFTFGSLQRSITYRNQTRILRNQVAEVLLAFLKAPGHLLLNEDLKKLF